MNKAKTVTNNKIRQGMSDSVFNTIVTVFVTIWMLIILYPLIYVVSSSFSSGEAVSSGKVLLWPVDISLMGYRLVFANKLVWSGYANTIFYTVTETTINMLYTTLAAYVLARRNFQARTFFAWLYIIPMWFGGGLIPTYILRSKLGLVNTRWVILAAGVGISEMIIMRTYIQSSIPGELHEAAKVDGINDFGYLFKIVLPLSKPVLSVLTLYFVVGHWNSYFGPLIYLRKRELQPLQLILQRILANADKLTADTMSDPTLLQQLANVADVMKYSLIVVSSAPMLVLFSLTQKFFTKGVMMGSLKG